jgi:hypothetical protein
VLHNTHDSQTVTPSSTALLRLRTKRIGSYRDVDISGTGRVDAEALRQLMDFSSALSADCGLVRNAGTKTYRDAEVLGLLPQGRLAGDGADRTGDQEGR